MDAVLTFSTALGYNQRERRVRVCVYSARMYVSVEACVLKCKHVNMFVFSSALI